MKRQLKRFVALVLAFALVLGYMPMSTIEAQAASKVSIKSLKLNKTQYVLKKGEKLKLKATISPKKAKVTWKSSNKKVATVSSKGVVKAVASKGTAKITAQSGKKKAICKITIGTPVKKITASNMTLTVGESKKINAKISPTKVKIKTLTYESKNKSVATVSKSGKVTAKKAGTAKIVITAKDRGKVKKTITVKVVAKAEKATATPGATKAPETTQTPEATKAPEATKVPTATPTPKVDMVVTTSDVPLMSGDKYTPEIKVSGEVTSQKIVWKSSDSNVAAVVGADGSIQALTSGECILTASLKEAPEVSVSYKVTVGKEEEQVVTTGAELATALTSGKATMITLNTEEAEITIPEGDYSKVTLVVNAPKSHIINKGTFKNVLIKGISENTWVETCGNKVFFNGPSGHLKVDAEGKPNVYLLDETEKLTVTNNGNLQELLIASAAKVLVKGDSIASRVACDVIAEGAEIDAYAPLDIYSTTTYQLNVGPGGEQTAIKVDEESSIPQINGIGTLSITIDSTGEKRTIIAENNGSISDLPTAKLTGKIIKEDTAAVGAKVYLVSYSKNVNGENISVYLNGATTKETKADENGAYTFENTAIGNYIIVVEAEGYELLTQNIYIPTTYAESIYEMEDILLLSDAGNPGGISGTVSNAETGEIITDKLTVFLRKGMNNITTTEVQKVTTNENGTYEFKDVTPGQYTIQIRDERETSEYVSEYYNVSVLSGAVITKNITLSKRLDSKELRFVLTWAEKGENVSEDLDIHLYGPNPYENKEYEVRFGSGEMDFYGWDMSGNGAQRAVLDVDDKEYAGPETITVKNIIEGQYKIFVQDYTNGGTGSGLATSKPEIKVYMGNTLLETIKMPEKTGGVWYACNYDAKTGKLTIVNDVYSGKANETTKAKIGTLFNKLEQFEVVDVAAFAKEQAVLDNVKEKYLKEQDETVLTTYLQQLEEVYRKITIALEMDEITGEGLNRYNFNSYRENHSFTVHGTAEKMPDLKVAFEDVDSVTSFVFDKKGDGYFYKNKLTITNHTLGVATNYFIDYYRNTEYWVEDITNDSNPEWKCSASYSVAYVEGLNENIGRDLEFVLMDGIVLESIEYKEDLKENWTYEDEYVAVAHLKKTATGDVKDYLITYSLLGAELNDITDTENVITDVVNSGMRGDNRYYIKVFGENKELGTTWKPQVREGATYVIQYPSEIVDESFSADARVIITYINGAKCTYDINYYQDTSAAEIIGVYDAENMYTRYDVYSNYSSEGREYYNLYLDGMNSKLGTNLKVYTRKGATAEVEYATASESFEGSSSDAKITVTAQNGVQRIYYVIYKKSDEEMNIRAITSASNELKKVHHEYTLIKIIGTQKELGNDLTIKVNEGYESAYDSENKRISITNTATGEVKVYYVEYTQDTTSVNLKKLTSKSQAELDVSIQNYLSKFTATDGSVEEFYLVTMKGQTKECPTDLVANVEQGNEVEITYAANTENWIYKTDTITYAAKILVKDETGFSKTYLVVYEHDASQAVINGITDENNTYAYSQISTYTTNVSCKDGTEEMVHIINIVGNNKNLGDTYQLSLPEGTKVVSTVSAGDNDWNFEDCTNSCSYEDKTTELTIIVYLTYEEKIVVEAANGAQKTYLIAYAQDESSTVVKGITDEKNTYLAGTEIANYHSTLMSTDEVNGVSQEKVYFIYVNGSNAQLGGTYQLTLNTGAKVSNVIRAGEEGWNYSITEVEHEYNGENGEYSSCVYKLVDRVVVEGANGAQRIYVIAYAQNTEGAKVTGITDENNTFLEEPKINTHVEVMNFKEEVDGIFSEEVYLIYLYGKNGTLGNTYKLDIPEGSVVESTICAGEEGWNYEKSTITRIYFDEEDNYIEKEYALSERVVVKASSGARRVYLIAYAPDESGAVVNGITDEENTYKENPVITTQQKSLRLNEMVDDSSSEDVYMIYVYGENATLGTDYKLDMPEGTVVGNTIRAGEDGWNYETTVVSYRYEDEEGNYNYREYALDTRVVVRAANGIEKVYVIAYAQDTSKASITKIEDTQNEYVIEPYISEEAESLSIKQSDGTYSEEEVYMIYVYGGNTELGTTYELTVPEETTLSEPVHVNDEAWPYVETTRNHQDKDENGNWIYLEYLLTDRVEVTSSNGVRKIYVIAYVQDMRGTVVKGITDAENTYIEAPKVEENTTYLNFKETIDDEYREEITLIYVHGKNKSLGTTYQLELPDGTEVESTIYAGEEGWNYNDTTTTEVYYDEEYNILTRTYILSARVVVKAKNGAKKVYVIAYCPDDSGVIVSGISDEENIYMNTQIMLDETRRLELSEPVNDSNFEDVYMMYVYGENLELGDKYQLVLPKGSVVSKRIHVGEEDWNYKNTKLDYSYYDENNKYITRTYMLCDKVIVTAESGLERTYVIAYQYDSSGAEITEITDTENTEFTVEEIETSTYELIVETVNAEGEAVREAKEIYLIYITGGNETLGNTYSITLPEGTTEVSRVSSTEENWKYLAIAVNDYTLSSEVVIKAKNGLERTYVIAYKQVAQ